MQDTRLQVRAAPACLPVWQPARGLGARSQAVRSEIGIRYFRGLFVGRRALRRSEPAFVYFEVYEPLLATAKEVPVIGVRLRILDRGNGQQAENTGVKTIASFMRQGDPAIPVISPLPVANLPAGRYQLEVTVMRQT